MDGRGRVHSGVRALLVAAAALALPVFLLTWVELVSVDQPAKVEPGAVFTATVQAVGRQGPWPGPLETGTDRLPVDGDTQLRLGVLVPDGWDVRSVVCLVDGGVKIGLQPASSAERSHYDSLHPPPVGYSWRAFGPVRHDAREGADIRFYAEIGTAGRPGVYRVGYMTWRGLPIAPLEDDGAGSPQTTWDIAEPSPSYLESKVTVGEVGPPPRVTAFDPPNAAADVPLDANIRITFDRDMDVRSLREGGVRLYQGPVWFATGRPDWKAESLLDPGWMPPPWPPYPVPALVFYNAETRTAVIDPLGNLHAKTVYTVVVTREAESADGVPLEVPVQADFLTAAGPWVPLFVDVPFDHIFRQAIETLAGAGIIHGYPDRTFRPYGELTRAQLATMLVRLLGVHTPELDSPAVYADLGTLPAETADFIGEATKEGIVEGFPDGTFRPSDTVTRIQLVRMVVRASQSWLAPPPPWFDAGFGDVAPLDLSYVNWASYNNLVDGKSPGRFDPWSRATRGHASRVLYGIWLRMPQPVPLGPG